MNIPATIQDYLSQAAEFGSANWAKFSHSSPTLANVIEKVGEVATNRFSLLIMSAGALYKSLSFTTKPANQIENGQPIKNVLPFSVKFNKGHLKTTVLAMALLALAYRNW